MDVRVLRGLWADARFAVIGGQDPDRVARVAQVRDGRAPGELVAAAGRVRRVDVAQAEDPQGAARIV